MTSKRKRRQHADRPSSRIDGDDLAYRLVQLGLASPAVLDRTTPREDRRHD